MLSGHQRMRRGGRRQARRLAGTAWRAVALALAVATGGCAATTGGQPSRTQTAQLDEAAAARVLDLAEEALAQGRHADARKIAQRVMVNDPRNPRGRLVLGEVMLAEGKPRQALEFFKPLQPSAAASSGPREADTAGEDGEVAANAQAKTAQTPPLDPRALQGQGVALLRLQRFADARTALERAVIADPGLWRAWNGLGFCHDRDGDWQAAEAAYDKALANGGDVAAVFNNRGFSRLMQGRSDAAIEDFGQALRLAPGLAVAETNMRLALAWRGDYARSVMGTGDREKAGALNNAGFVAMLRGDYDSAETYLLRAMDADAGFNAAAHKNLAYMQTLRDADTRPIEAQVGMSPTPEADHDVAE